MAHHISSSTYSIWEGYSDQEFEDARRENRLEELVRRLADKIRQEQGVSKTKLKIGCRAIYMIPPNQAELIGIISSALEVQGAWKFAQEGYFNASRPYYKVLTAAQKEAISRKNLPAALELVSKIKQVDPSLKRCVLESLPEKTLITRVVEKDQKNIWPEKKADRFNVYDNNGYMFADPNSENFSKSSQVLELLKDYEPSKHLSLTCALSKVITFCDEAADVREIVSVLNKLGDQLDECVEAARHVFRDGWSGQDKAALMQVIRDLPPGTRVSICKACDQLSSCSLHLTLSWKIMKKFLPFQRKGVVIRASKKEPDSYSYQRFVPIIQALKVLDSSLFVENVAAAKAYLDAGQLLHKSPIPTSEICEVIAAIHEKTFRPSEISYELMQFSEPRREWLLKIYRKRLSVNEFSKYLPFFKKISEAEMRTIYNFFNVKKDQYVGWNQKFDDVASVWDEVLKINPGEIENVLRGTQLLMRALGTNTGHRGYIFAQLQIEKNIRQSLSEKLFLLFSLGDIREQTALRLVLLVSKLPPEKLTKEIYDVLRAFESTCKRNEINELLKLPTEIFTQLSFHYCYEPIDRLGQERLKRAIQNAGDNYHFAGLRSSDGFSSQPTQHSQSCCIQ